MVNESSFFFTKKNGRGSRAVLHVHPSVRAQALLQRVPLRRTVEFPAQRPAGQELGAAAAAAQPVGAVPRKKPMGLGWSYGGKMMGKP